MAIDEGLFKRVMSHFPSGITVVTTAHEGAQYGMTVSSFASLSLRPPLVVICIEKGVPTHDAIAAAGQFGVSILRREQESISTVFATKTEDRFAGMPIVTGRTGLPLIEGSLARIQCRLYDSLPGGDHTIFVGEIEEAEVGEGSPLLYYRGGYHSLG